jgi:hypothetical protein
MKEKSKECHKCTATDLKVYLQLHMNLVFVVSSLNTIMKDAAHIKEL